MIINNNSSSSCFFKWKWLVCIFLLVTGSALPAQCNSSPDLLRIPAQTSARAVKSILMDVVNNQGRLVTVGERGHILYSDTHGRTWEQAEVPVSVTLTSVYFVTAQKGWAVGHDGVILHTRDGGKRWQKQLDGTAINALMLTQLKQMIKTKTQELEVTRLQPDATLDQSLSLELEDLDYFLSDVEMGVHEGPTRPLMDLWFKNEREGIVLGSFGMILATTDGGVTWTPLLDRIDNPQGLHFYGITWCGDSLFIAGEGGMLFRSRDWGKNWQLLESPYAGSFFGITGSSDGRFVVAFGLRGAAFFSHDQGKTWNASKSNSGFSVSGGLVSTDGSVWLARGDGTLMRSKDEGRSFSTLPSRFPGTISLTETDNGKLVLVGLKGVTVLEKAYSPIK